MPRSSGKLAAVQGSLGQKVRTGGLWVFSAAMVGVGVLHFVRPEPFVAIVPPYLPEPLLLVYISGFFEVIGGVGLVVPRTRRWASWGLILLYIAVFPANIHMAIEAERFAAELQIPEWSLYTRLLYQLVLAAWALWATRPDPQAGTEKAPD